MTEEESYSHGYGAASEVMAQRTASSEAAFFLPHLNPGMSLLDCGCGPGAITVDLAETLAPREVVGIDLGESQIELARALAAERHVSDVRFEVANIYELPFPDDTFDAAFAHTALEHVGNPVAALKEMRRVLKPGGVVGIREEDWGSLLLAPHMPLVEEMYELYLRFWQHNGGDPYLPRRYREILREAGFAAMEITASAEVRADLETTRSWAQLVSRGFREPSILDPITELGWADQVKVEKMSDALLAWGEHRDAFMALINGEGVGWKE